MKGPGYPEGVPTPYAMHVHPYPTRFHGAIYSRPTFGMEQLQTPQSVFIPGRDIDMTPDRPYTGNAFNGLGDLQYNVGEGIFRPGGYGGGVFDGNLAGMPTKVKGARSLGANDSVSAEQKASDAANFPFGKYSAQTKQLQDKLNHLLVKNGYCPLIADGKLGPATCGAAIYPALQADPEYVKLAPYMPTTCQDVKSPTLAKNGCGTGPLPPPGSAITPTTATLSMSTGMSSSTKKLIGFAAGAIGAVGLVYYVKKKRR